MSDVADYDTDILLWSERQAALLRDLKTRAPGLSNELDLENVAEEIESVGRTEFRAAGSFLSLILEHAIKGATYPSSDAALHWFSEMRTFHRNYLSAVSPAMRARFDLDRLWRKVRKDQLADMNDRGETLPDLPVSCPFVLTDFDEDAFDARKLVARLTALVSSGEPERP